MEGVASDPVCGRLGLWETELHSFWTWVPAANYLSSSEFALTWQLIRNGLSLNDVAFRDAWADMTDCHRCQLGLEKTTARAFYHCPQVRLFWDYFSELTARIDPEHLVSADLAYLSDNVSPRVLSY